MEISDGSIKNKMLAENAGNMTKKVAELYINTTKINGIIKH